MKNFDVTVSSEIYYSQTYPNFNFEEALNIALDFSNNFPNFFKLDEYVDSPHFNFIYVLDDENVHITVQIGYGEGELLIKTNDKGFFSYFNI